MREASGGNDFPLVLVKGSLYPAKDSHQRRLVVNALKDEHFLPSRWAFCPQE